LGFDPLPPVILFVSSPGFAITGGTTGFLAAASAAAAISAGVFLSSPTASNLVLCYNKR